MNDDCQLTYSPLCRKVDVNGKEIDVLIYEDVSDGWFLEVVDGFGNSIIYDDRFATDELALNYSHEMVKAIAKLG